MQKRGVGEHSSVSVRRGCGPTTIAAILEAGRPKESRNYGAHEFTTPGVYCCLGNELSPFSYATRSRITLSVTEQDPQDDDIWTMPSSRFIAVKRPLWV